MCPQCESVNGSVSGSPQYPLSQVKKEKKKSVNMQTVPVSHGFRELQWPGKA